MHGLGEPPNGLTSIMIYQENTTTSKDALYCQCSSLRYFDVCVNNTGVGKIIPFLADQYVDMCPKALAAPALTRHADIRRGFPPMEPLAQLKAGG